MLDHKTVLIVIVILMAIIVWAEVFPTSFKAF